MEYVTCVTRNSHSLRKLLSLEVSNTSTLQLTMDADGAYGRNADSQDVTSHSTTAPGYVINPLMSDFGSDWSLLHEAATHGRLGSLSKLITQGHNVNLITADHVTPLHEACLGGHPGCVNFLLKHGAQVNIPNIDWKTPIFNACVSGSAACVNLLLQHGASPHAVCDVASPIHEASMRGHTECVESLSNAGVNIQNYIEHMGSPLYVACDHQNVHTAKRLLELGASANIGRDLDTPLHSAARNSNAELVKLLLDYGGSTQSKNADGKRPSEIVPHDSTLQDIILKKEGRM